MGGAKLDVQFPLFAPDDGPWEPDASFEHLLAMPHRGITGCDLCDERNTLGLVQVCWMLGSCPGEEDGMGSLEDQAGEDELGAQGAEPPEEA